MKNNDYTKPEFLDVEEDVYRKAFGVNWHSLERMSISPEQYLWELTSKPKETKSMAFGTIVHTALLETEKFLDRVESVDFNRGTKAFKGVEEGNPEQIIVSKEEKKMILIVIDKFRKNKFYDTLMKDANIERAIRWRNKDTGIVCKGRPDLFTDKILMDIKTSMYIEDDRWWWDFKKRKYHCQFGYYQEGLECVDGKRRICLVIKVETVPCFDVVYYPVPTEAIVEGRIHYLRLLGELRDCIDAKCWPGKGGDELAEVYFDNWTIDRRKYEWAK